MFNNNSSFKVDILSLAVLLKFIREFAMKSEAYRNLADKHYSRGNYQEAKKYYNIALSFNEKDSLSTYSLGLIAFNDNNIDKSVEYFEKAIKIDPYLAPAFVDLGVAYYNKGELDLAIDNLKHALSLNPKDPVAYAGLGTVYINTGQTDLAKESFSRAKEIDPALSDGIDDVLKKLA